MTDSDEQRHSIRTPWGWTAKIPHGLTNELFDKFIEFVELKRRQSNAAMDHFLEELEFVRPLVVVQEEDEDLPSAADVYGILSDDKPTR